MKGYSQLISRVYSVYIVRTTEWTQYVHYFINGNNVLFVN